MISHMPIRQLRMWRMGTFHFPCMATALYSKNGFRCTALYGFIKSYMRPPKHFASSGGPKNPDRFSTHAVGHTYRTRERESTVAILPLLCVAPHMHSPFRVSGHSRGSSRG